MNNSRLAHLERRIGKQKPFHGIEICFTAEQETAARAAGKHPILIEIVEPPLYDESEGAI